MVKPAKERLRELSWNAFACSQQHINNMGQHHTLLNMSAQYICVKKAYIPGNPELSHVHADTGTADM
jgi:hypothetical protein